MKKKVKVIRTANKTIVIYSEPTKARDAAPVMQQKPVPVWHNGKHLYYIMPDGRYIPVREGLIWRIIKTLRPSAQFSLAV